MVKAISFGERGPGSIPGETHVEEIIRFLKMGVPCGLNHDRLIEGQAL